MAVITGNELDNNLAGAAGVSNVISGGGGNDYLQGYGGADQLSGEDGNDVLNGSTGLDILYGGAGSDAFVIDTTPSPTTLVDPFTGMYYRGNAHGNFIPDFTTGEDSIVLLKNTAVFNNLPIGILADDMLRIGPTGVAAQDANDFLIYDTTSQTLYYDADANGPAEALDIMKKLYYNPSAPLRASDIEVVARNVVSGTVGDDYLTGTAGIDSLGGSGGNDVLYGGSGNDSLAGGSGLDFATYTGVRADYEVTRQTYNARIVDMNTVDRNEGIDTTAFVERLRFADMSVALDLEVVTPTTPDWNGHAGLVAKTIGAVFGKSYVGDLDLVGLGLYHMDQLNDYEALVQLALTARLGASATDREVVDLLYTNVAGTAPSEATAQQYVDLLASGAYTHASLGVFAADHATNIANIDFVGMMARGLNYHEYGV